MKTIFEKSVAGRKGVDAGAVKPGAENILPDGLRRKTELKLPELSEFDVIRHFTGLSRLNFSVDTEFYPLGSCTMKYNPKINEVISVLPGFTGLHPYTTYINESACQGAYEVVYDISNMLAEITGMEKVTPVSSPCAPA